MPIDSNLYLVLDELGRCPALAYYDGEEFFFYSKEFDMGDSPRWWAEWNEPKISKEEIESNKKHFMDLQNAENKRMEDNEKILSYKKMMGIINKGLK